MIEHFTPVQQVIGRSYAHLAVFALGVGEIVHPVFAVNFFWNHGAGLGPLHIPFAGVAGNDDAVALPVNQVFRSGEAKLGIFSVGGGAVHVVVAGVGEVIGVAEFLQARIFHAAAFFIRGFG